jgi:hypothetical protein
MEAIPMIWQFGIAGGLGLLVVISVILGWFIPKSSHVREMAAEVRRADEWKQIAEDRGTIITTQTAQITSLLEVSKFIETVFRAAGPVVDEQTGPSRWNTGGA